MWNNDEYIHVDEIDIHEEICHQVLNLEELIRIIETAAEIAHDIIEKENKKKESDKKK